MKPVYKAPILLETEHVTLIYMYLCNLMLCVMVTEVAFFGRKTVLLHHISLNNGTVTLEVGLLKYKYLSRQRCDNLILFQKCDPFFKVCFETPPEYRCDWTETSGLDEKDELTDILNFRQIKPNPISDTFDKWHGNTRMRIQIWDANLFSADRKIDEANWTYTGSANISLDKVFLLGNRKKASVSVYIKVSCDENYYGPSCTIYCRPTTHTFCNENGTAQCISGFSGSNCSTIIKSPTLQPEAFSIQPTTLANIVNSSRKDFSVPYTKMDITLPKTSSYIQNMTKIIFQRYPVTTLIKGAGSSPLRFEVTKSYSKINDSKTTLTPTVYSSEYTASTYVFNDYTSAKYNSTIPYLRQENQMTKSLSYDTMQNSFTSIPDGQNYTDNTTTPVSDTSLLNYSTSGYIATSDQFRPISLKYSVTKMIPTKDRSVSSTGRRFDWYTRANVTITPSTSLDTSLNNVSALLAWNKYISQKYDPSSNQSLVFYTPTDMLASKFTYNFIGNRTSHSSSRIDSSMPTEGENSNLSAPPLMLTHLESLKFQINQTKHFSTVTKMPYDKTSPATKSNTFLFRLSSSILLGTNQSMLHNISQKSSGSPTLTRMFTSKLYRNFTSVRTSGSSGSRDSPTHLLTSSFSVGTRQSTVLDVQGIGTTTKNTSEDGVPLLHFSSFSDILNSKQQRLKTSSNTPKMQTFQNSEDTRAVKPTHIYDKTKIGRFTTLVSEPSAIELFLNSSETTHRQHSISQYRGSTQFPLSVTAIQRIHVKTIPSPEKYITSTNKNTLTTGVLTTKPSSLNGHDDTLDTDSNSEYNRKQTHSFLWGIGLSAFILLAVCLGSLIMWKLTKRRKPSSVARNEEMCTEESTEYPGEHLRLRLNKLEVIPECVDNPAVDTNETET